jgi:hypothetical protein
MCTTSYNFLPLGAETILLISSAAAAAIIKTIELQNLTSSDFTYDATNLSYWLMTENYVIIIAACVPTLRPLFNAAISSWSEKRSASGNENQSYGSTTYISASHATSRGRSWFQISKKDSQHSQEIA